MDEVEMSKYRKNITYARKLFDDLNFGYVREWKAKNPSRRAIGYLPIYIPREVIRAAGMLPVEIFGGGERVQVVKGDAFFQSYICHLPRTVIELALDGNYDDLDGFIFPAICDVIRNLSGIFRIKFADKYIRYLDFPQNFSQEAGGEFYRTELNRLIEDLAKLNGIEISTDSLNESISLYNLNRRLIGKLRKYRNENPHKISAVDYYLVMRAGTILEVEEHNNMLSEILASVDEIEAPAEDKIRVLISGSFCEQPPIGLIKTIENAGCYIVEDDFQLGLTWFDKDLDNQSADPLATLVDAYLNSSTISSAVYDADRPKGAILADQVQASGADGVIFCAPSFCDPALLDRPLLEKAMDEHNVRHFSFQYHENLGQFHVIKEQAGTFSDTIKLWE